MPSFFIRINSMTHTTNLGMKTNVGQDLIFKILTSIGIEIFYKKTTLVLLLGIFNL